MEEKSERKVLYADRDELEMEILRKYPQVTMSIKFEKNFDEIECNKKASRIQKVFKQT